VNGDRAPPLKAIGWIAVESNEHSLMSLAFLHPGDLSASERLALLWYWLGIPVVVIVGIFLLVKLGRWSGRKSNRASDSPKH
jgi:hypothetical protein